ncbi:hypothetical protein ATCR1_21335 [Agrobacterium tumefaciens CCNWGS0286]|uniref:hypothetical protein n=1 Tax=Agrobacterium tumefaciens TaxID=358 RepID=UPI0002334BEC|nr:hypothetical protein [Agrobacterium tumefaciens]EHH03367.1 hypothetical protein ATCR1_21335 [Agrobacterium tumefaciens CCNWGS0286]
MGGEAMYEDDDGAAAIAAYWRVDVDLLNDANWELESLDGNDGEIYGYLVRFDDDTDEELLLALGLQPGEFTREVGLNAFDTPDYDPES